MCLDLLTAANWYHDNGFETVALARGTKRAVHKWKGVILSEKQRQHYFTQLRCDLALKTGSCSRIAVLDIDNDAGLDKAQNQFGETGWKVSTPSGGQHWYYSITNEVISNRVRLFGVGLDLRCENGLIKAPPSTGYCLLERGSMRPFDLLWLPPKQQHRKISPFPATNNRRIRSRMYLAKIIAIEGEGGDTQLYKAACALIRIFGLNQQEAFEELSYWNVYNAHPPFCESRLRYKISEAMKE